MCNRPDFEGEELELDQRLVSLFRYWKAYTEFWVELETVSDADLVTAFCDDVRNRLPELLRQEKEEVQEGTGGPG